MASRTGKKPTTQSFRVGRVRCYKRGRIWYLAYSEDGRRRQPRVGPDRDLARQQAAEINSQLEAGAPSSLGFEPASIAEVRSRWLAQHEHVRRSSVQTIRRYRSATQHLLNFVEGERPLRRISDFRPVHAEEFVRYLRSIKVALNGHKHALKRRLRDCGVKYILETCSALFNYARRQRHLSPYAENPFGVIEVGRIPIEDAKPIVVLDDDLERRFFAACDKWQLPVFLTLLCTGLRPGELTHLLLPDDADLENGWLHVRNKPQVGWRVKTRTERSIPLVPTLKEVLRKLVGDRKTGPVFLQRQYVGSGNPPLEGLSFDAIVREIDRQVCRSSGHQMDDARLLHQRASAVVWRKLGGFRPEWIRVEFMRLMARLGHPEISAPKTLRHTFATILQDANVDPLIRNELMGHSTLAVPLGGASLGMTTIYTHTRKETMRRQLEGAFVARLAYNQ